ncbi:unnamed protein product [Rotaria magnacalcarata]
MENFNLFFTIDANERMIEWSDYLKKRSAAEKGNDHLAARLGKCVQYAHRIVGFLYIIELSYLIGAKYLSSNGHFPINGTITKEFVDEVKILFNQQFSQYNTHDHQNLVTLEMVERCRDMLTGNLEQYKLLMYVAPEEGAMGITQSSNSLTFSKTEFPNEPLSKKQKRVIKLQPRLAEIMSRILLFRSVAFTITGLYVDRIIKRSAAILGLAINKLVEMNLLLFIKKGFFSSKWTPIYVKRLPDNSSAVDQMQFEMKRAEIDFDDLNLQNVREASNELIISGKGKLSNELMHFLQRSEYNELNLDIHGLTREFGGCHSSIETDSCDISDQWIETTATTEELSSSSESIKPDFVMGNKNVTSNDACSSNVNPEPIHDVQNEDKNEYVNEDKANSNQKHHIIFKPRCSPISSRLRRKK